MLFPFTDLQNKSADELKELLLEKREELRILRFKVSEHQLKEVHKISDLRKHIAQICSLLKIAS